MVIYQAKLIGYSSAEVQKQGKIEKYKSTRSPSKLPTMQIKSQVLHACL